MTNIILLAQKKLTQVQKNHTLVDCQEEQQLLKSLIANPNADISYNSAPVEGKSKLCLLFKQGNNSFYQFFELNSIQDKP